MNLDWLCSVKISHHKKYVFLLVICYGTQRCLYVIYFKWWQHWHFNVTIAYTATLITDQWVIYKLPIVAVLLQCAVKPSGLCTVDLGRSILQYLSDPFDLTTSDPSVAFDVYIRALNCWCTRSAPLLYYPQCKQII